MYALFKKRFTILRMFYPGKPASPLAPANPGKPALPSNPLNPGGPGYKKSL
jgi:hypothetical protein